MHCLTWPTKRGHLVSVRVLCNKTSNNMNSRPNQPRIDEIIGFLYDFSLPSISGLEKKYPNFSSLFKRGIELGESSRFSNDELDIRTEICLKGLEAVNAKCSELIPKIKKRLITINRIQLANQIVVALGGASILSVLQNDGYVSLKYIGASLVLIGSLLNIYFLYLSNTITPNNNNIFKDFDIIVSTNFDAQKVQQELLILKQISTKNENNIAEIKKNIEKGNDLCFELKKVLTRT